jgi:hypothetical protein
LDVTGCTGLAYLGCSSNALTALDVTGCTWLSELYCDSNALTALDVTGCTELSELYCDSNALTDVALNTFFDTLPDDGFALIFVYENPGSATCDPSIATTKGHTVYTEQP